MSYTILLIAMIGMQSSFDDQYYGSRMFMWPANMCGLSVDVANFLICQIIGLFLASLFRCSLLHSSNASNVSRHAFGLIVGLVFGFICFGHQAIHIVGLPAICYIVICTQNPLVVQQIVLLVAMVYLSSVHIYRLYYDYGSANIDITGPLMMITQKVTTLAFSLHDGTARDPAALSASQRCQAVRRIPSALEYFAFCLHFQSLLAGPIVLFGDYIDFIEGVNWRHCGSTELDRTISETGHGEPLLGGQIVHEPSPTRTVVQKMLGSVLCAFVYMKFGQVYPIKNIKDAYFVGQLSFTGKFWYIMNSTMFVRFKYYHAWLMGDAICNNSGLGFNGYDTNGRAKWNMCSNIDILGFEFATNFRDSINSWNIATNRWLRQIVYERVPKRFGTVLTFGLSALWHGFYPGYYITFASGALIVTAARLARKHIRHRFQHLASTRLIYDILTVLITRVFMAYATFPFVALEFKASLNLYQSLYMCLHLIAAISIVVIPQYLDKKLSAKTHVNTYTNISTMDTIDQYKMTTTSKSSPRLSFPNHYCDISNSNCCRGINRAQKLPNLNESTQYANRDAGNVLFDARYMLSSMRSNGIDVIDATHQSQQQQQLEQHHFVAGEWQ